MKYLALLCILFPAAYLFPITDNTYTLSVSQDSLGNYMITYHTGNISKVEERLQDGTLAGSYSYNDAAGQPRTISYIAGHKGLQVGTSPAVKEVKHLEEIGRKIEELEKSISRIREAAPFTPDVLKVTIEHLKAVEIAKIAVKQGGFANCVLPEQTKIADGKTTSGTV